jgi:hypothetical protein
MMKRDLSVFLPLFMAFILSASWLAVASESVAMEIYKDENVAFSAGFWGQLWYQTISDGRDTDGDGQQDKGIYDTLVRRAYLYAKADFLDKITLFTHLAGDRIGQDYMKRRPSLGLGANMVFRDAWITFDFFDDAFKIQVGRMYVPLTRNYGTTSTKAMLNLDLDWAQGGVRGGIFYPSRVGRDDGLCLWGNVFEKRLQYRFMVAKGVYDDDINPGDHPRFAGRLSWAFWEPETAWFNQGTYLGKKKVLTVGAGFDFQDNLRTGPSGNKQDYSAWTLDIHWDQPLGPDKGAVTAEAAVIHVNNGVNSLNYTRFSRGGDATIYSLKAGHLLPWRLFFGRIQPNIHFERIDPESGEATNIYGGGINYFFKGHANKLSFDVTSVDQEDELDGKAQDHLIFTLQLALGF